MPCRDFVAAATIKLEVGAEVTNDISSLFPRTPKIEEFADNLGDLFEDDT